MRYAFSGLGVTLETLTRPAGDFTGMIFIRIFPNKIHAL